MSLFIAWISPSSSEMSSVCAPASSSACLGRMYSTSSTPSAARNAIVLPLSFSVMRFVLPSLGEVVQLPEAVGQDARDLHLREPDDVGDLALQELVPEAQLDDQPIALGQAAQQRVDRGGVLHASVAGVLDRRRGERRLLAGARTRLERLGAMRARALERVEHALDRLPELGGEPGPGRRAAQPDGQRMRDPLDAQRELLELARHAHGPAVVAEVALDLPEDRGRGERREGAATVGVEALDRLDEGQRRHLSDVVGLAAAGIAAREMHGERQEARDQRIPHRSLAVAAVAAEQLVLLTAPAHDLSGLQREGGHGGSLLDGA